MVPPTVAIQYPLSFLYPKVTKSKLASPGLSNTPYSREPFTILGEASEGFFTEPSDDFAVSEPDPFCEVVGVDVVELSDGDTFLLADGVRVGLGSCTLEGTVVPVGIECFALDGTVTSASTPLPGDMIDSGDGECVSLSPDDGCGGTLSFSLFAKLPQTGTSRDNPSHLARVQPI